MKFRERFRGILKKIKKMKRKKAWSLNFEFLMNRKKKVGVHGFIKGIPNLLFKKKDPSGLSYTHGSRKKIVSWLYRLFGSKKKDPSGLSRKRFAVLGVSVVLLFAAGLAVASVIGSFSTGDINKGLVGHWPMDGAHLNSTTNRVDDISGYGNHGTNSGASLTTDRHGQANGAMSFGGDGDYIGLSYAPQFNIREAITLSVWIKRTTGFSQTQDCHILSRPPSWYFYDSYNSGNIQGDVFIDGVRRAAKTVLVPFDGGWYHVVYTYDSNSKTATISINGELYSSTTLSGLSNYLIDSSTANFVHAGAHTLGRGLVFGDMRIYDRALGEGEVKKLYETYKPKFSVGGENKGLARHYSFDNFGEWTENLAPYVDYSNRTYGQGYAASSWGGDLATIYYYEDGGYNDLPYKKMVKTTGGTGGSYLDDNQYITIEDNTTYIISAWMKASRDQSFNGLLLDINRPSDNAYRTGDGIDLTTEWTRYSWTYNAGSGHAGQYHTRHIIYIDDNLPLEVYWSGFQIEEKDHITPFVDGIRNDYARDNSGYASHADLSDSNTPEWIEEDDLRQGVYEFLKGEEKRIRIPDPFLYTKTISFWVKVKEGEHTSGEAVPFLVYNDGVIQSSGDSNQILLCMQGDKFRMHGWGSLDPLAISDINDGDWHHLIWHMNYHATDPAQRLMNMWVDGTKEVSDFSYSQGSFGPVADSYWWVGYNSRSYSPYLRDSGIFIDDIRFYDRVLSQTEVDVLYAKSMSGSSVGTSTTNLNKGLVGQWDLKSKSEKVGSELHPNWGMESGTANWVFDGKGSGTINSETSNYFYGSKSLRVKNATGGPIAVWDPPSGETIGSLYRVSVWAKNIDCPTIPYFSSSGATKISGNYSFTGISTTEWKYYSAIFEATATTPNIYIRTDLSATQGEFLLDNFSLKPIETADSTPYGNHGTIYGATVGDDYTSFNGDGDYVSGDISEISETKRWSISMRFKTSDASGYLIDTRTGNQNGVGIFTSGTNNLSSYLQIGSTVKKYYEYETTYVDNNWHHVVIERNADNSIVMYFDGILINPFLITTDLDMSSDSETWSNFVLAIRHSLDSSYLQSQIADVKIYDRALSAGEVKLLYDKGR